MIQGNAPATVGELVRSPVFWVGTVLVGLFLNMIAPGLSRLLGKRVFGAMTERRKRRSAEQARKHRKRVNSALAGPAGAALVLGMALLSFTAGMVIWVGVLVLGVGAIPHLAGAPLSAVLLLGCSFLTSMALGAAAFRNGMFCFTALVDALHVEARKNLQSGEYRGQERTDKSEGGEDRVEGTANGKADAG